MDSIYSDKLNEVKNKLVQYQNDIDKIIRLSRDISNDIVKYSWQIIQKDNNLEIGRIVVEKAIVNHLTLAELLKIIVKILCILKDSERYKHGDYFTTKKYIDDALRASDATAAKLALKKYEMILQNMSDAGEFSKLGLKNQQSERIPNKKEAIDDIKDNINRNYIQFI
ncbi:MAG: hypothetical protein MZV70_11215 [Desulfobacterales bacterium]|nr:hypothetical protein [Desulfobacterales bacterium]